MKREASEARDKLPIVYSKKYAVRFGGLEKLHPFDAAKGKHIQQVSSYLCSYGMYACNIHMYMWT